MSLCYLDLTFYLAKVTVAFIIYLGYICETVQCMKLTLTTDIALEL